MTFSLAHKHEVGYQVPVLPTKVGLHSRPAIAISSCRWMVAGVFLGQQYLEVLFGEDVFPVRVMSSPQNTTTL